MVNKIVKKVRKKVRKQFADKSFEEVLRGALIVFSSRIGETIFTMGTSILIARIYGAEVVGALAAVRAIMEILIIFGLMGTDIGLLRMIPQQRKVSEKAALDMYQQVLRMVLLSSLALSVMLYFGSTTLAEQLNKEHLAPFYALAAIFIVPKTLFKLNLEALRGMKRFGDVAIQNISLAIGNLTTLVILSILVTYKYIPIYSYLITMAIVGIVSTILVFRAFIRVVKPGMERAPLKLSQIITLSAPMFMTKSAFLILGYADIIMLTNMRTEAEVGYYQVAWKLIMFNKFFKNSITSTAAPKLAELHAGGEHELLKSVAKKTTMLLGYTVLPFVIGMVVFGKTIIGTLYGPEFLAGYSAFVLLGCAQMITAVLGHVGMFMNMTGKQTTYLGIVFVSALMNIGFNLLWIPEYGITGAAMANVISVLFTHVVATVYIYRNFGFTIAYPPFIGIFKSLKK